MIRIHIFCEGQTEEAFVREVLFDHFIRQNIGINPIVVRTSEKGKGGVSNYRKIKYQIDKQCKEDRTAYVTTMLDFYGLPSDFPGITSRRQTQTHSFQYALLIKNAFQSDINHTNFIANFMVHEFEGILFSQPNVFDEYFEVRSLEKLKSEIREFESPEHINDDPNTAPSKRILNYYPQYQKVADGVILAQEIGLDKIRSNCLHFNEWIEKLEKLGGDNQLKL